jgi:hypothetical protein
MAPLLLLLLLQQSARCSECSMACRALQSAQLLSDLHCCCRALDAVQNALNQGELLPADLLAQYGLPSFCPTGTAAAAAAEG